MARARDGRCVTVTVTLKPRSRKTGIEVSSDGLLIRVKALPVEGRANAEALSAIADAFGVPKSSVSLVSGARSRIKRFRIRDPARMPAGLSL